MSILKVAKQYMQSQLLHPKSLPALCRGCRRLFSDNADNMVNPPLPPRKPYDNETTDIKRARLIYQSRKRGTAENCLIFSTFAARYLSSMTAHQLNLYDKLINEVSNEWDLYYWIVGSKPTPAEYESEIMAMLQEHARNTQREVRFKMPDL